jgi:hypothetical protein
MCPFFNTYSLNLLPPFPPLCFLCVMNFFHIKYHYSPISSSPRPILSSRKLMQLQITEESFPNLASLNLLQLYL